MGTYIVKRLLLLIPILIGVTLITFILMRIIPGDPVLQLMDPRAARVNPEVAAKIKAYWGLDKPPHIQYLKFVWNALHGHLGYSYRSNQDVLKVILERFPATAKLTLFSMGFAIFFGILIGVISAIKHNTFIDIISMTIALIGVSTPIFWLGLILMYVFGVLWPILPPSGYGPGISYLILPSLTLGYAVTAFISRISRSSVLNVIGMDYVTTARAKGLSERIVIYKHVLKNALIPIITIIGIETGWLLGGAIVTETVFSWPGIGRLLIESIMARDLPMVQGCILFIALLFSLVNLAVDIIYSLIDPRVKYGKE